VRKAKEDALPTQKTYPDPIVVRNMLFSSRALCPLAGDTVITLSDTEKAL
jgi:hypothetical protein